MTGYLGDMSCIKHGKSKKINIQGQGLVNLVKFIYKIVFSKANFIGIYVLQMSLHVIKNNWS